MEENKYWYERQSVELISLKEGDNFYMPDAVSFLPYKLLKLPKDNGLMCYCETPSGNKNYYYGSHRVVKQNLFDINPEL